jgi:hypothetical protein
MGRMPHAIETSEVIRQVDESTLREKARSALKSGKLPYGRAERMWGGPGSGDNCAVCGDSVTREEMGFELEFAGDGERPGPVNHELHMRCFAAWEFERESVTAKSGSPAADEPSTPATELSGPMGFPSGPGMAGSGLPSAQNHGTIANRERDSICKRKPE